MIVEKFSTKETIEKKCSEREISNKTKIELKPHASYRLTTLDQANDIEKKPSCLPKRNSSAELFSKKEDTSTAKVEQSEDNDSDDENLVAKKQKMFKNRLTNRYNMRMKTNFFPIHNENDSDGFQENGPIKIPFGSEVSEDNQITDNKEEEECKGKIYNCHILF